jgi:RhoGAP domain
MGPYDSSGAHKALNGLPPPMLNNDNRSKSYGGFQTQEEVDSTYADTLNDIRRLRSTRMDRTLSTNTKKARQSRIIGGPEADSIQDGGDRSDGKRGNGNEMRIVEDRDANGDNMGGLNFGSGPTLDDIPRIVAAHEAAKQRPNAYRHQRNALRNSSGPTPTLFDGHRRSPSDAQALDRAEALDLATTGGELPRQGKRYFSELTALEYFVIRHLAVIHMQPMLEDLYTLDELVPLIEQNRPSFWGKIGKAFKNDNTKKKKKGTFGVPLETLVERDFADSTSGIGPGALRIPALIDDCVVAMRQMDMSVEGVFRKNGNIRRLKELSESIDNKGSETVDLTKETPVQIAALLKRFLRELPDPVLTFKLHRLFITTQSRFRCFHLRIRIANTMIRDSR